MSVVHFRYCLHVADSSGDNVHPHLAFTLDFANNANKAVMLHVYKLGGSQQQTLHAALSQGTTGSISTI